MDENKIDRVKGEDAKGRTWWGTCKCSADMFEVGATVYAHRMGQSVGVDGIVWRENFVAVGDITEVFEDNFDVIVKFLNGDVIRMDGRRCYAISRIYSQRGYGGFEKSNSLIVQGCKFFDKSEMVVGDGAVGDGAVGDGAVGDGAVGDGAVGDGWVVLNCGGKVAADGHGGWVIGRRGTGEFDNVGLECVEVRKFKYSEIGIKFNRGEVVNIIGEKWTGVVVALGCNDYRSVVPIELLQSDGAGGWQVRGGVGVDDSSYRFVSASKIRAI